MEFFKQLEDHRWLQRREEIIHRDGKQCQICGYRGESLMIYIKNHRRLIWEAKDEDLVTMCRDCYRTAKWESLEDVEYKLSKANKTWKAG